MRLLILLLTLMVGAAEGAARPEVTILFLGADIREPPAAEPLRPTVARRRFRIRVDARGARAPRARLFAAVAADVPGREMKVDGITLTTMPQLISAETPLGAPESHTLEVETLGAVIADQTIIWTAEVR